MDGSGKMPAFVVGVSGQQFPTFQKIKRRAPARMGTAAQASATMPIGAVSVDGLRGFEDGCVLDLATAIGVRPLQSKSSHSL